MNFVRRLGTAIPVSIALWLLLAAAAFGGTIESHPQVLPREPRGIAVEASGSQLVADPASNRLYRYAAPPARDITVVAGTGQSGMSGDGGPAVNAQLNAPSAVAIGSDGSIFLVDRGNCRIRKISPQGIITTAAGTGLCSYGGDGGPAVAAFISNTVYGIAAAPDGGFTFPDMGARRARHVSPAGIITTIAGGGPIACGGDGALATAVNLGAPSSVAYGSDGALYVSDLSCHRVRRVGTDNIITTVVGTGSPGFSPDGSPATSAINAPWQIAMHVGALLFLEVGNRRVRKAEGGVLTTEAGNGLPGCTGENVNALNAAVDGAGLAVNAAWIFVSDQNCKLVRRVSRSGPVPTITATQPVLTPTATRSGTATRTATSLPTVEPTRTGCMVVPCPG